MRRRDFMSLLGSAVASWPLAASAQQSAKLPTVGLLGAGTPSAWSLWVAAFYWPKVDIYSCTAHICFWG
jgi:putative tryptophan/tyrosine transport system substrate-binding protein